MILKRQHLFLCYVGGVLGGFPFRRPVGGGAGSANATFGTSEHLIDAGGFIGPGCSDCRRFVALDS